MAQRSGISLPSGAQTTAPELEPDAPTRVDERVEAPRYRVAGDVPFFDGGRLYAPGDELVHHGEPGPNLEPLNPAAKNIHEPLMKALEDDPNAQSRPAGMIAYSGAQAPSQADQIADLKRRLAALEKA